MSFSALFFVFTWLPIALVLYFLVPKKYKNLYLVIVSMLFYSWGEPSYVFLLGLLIIINYYFGIWIANNDSKKRKIILIEALILNVFVLFYFKYYGFILDTIFSFIPSQPAIKILSMPLGISFFTFSILAYLIDVYLKKTNAEKNFISFALYVSFFPKLIMGPITTYREMKDQIISHPQYMSLFNDGAKRFVIGLAQKVILANTFSLLYAGLHSQPLTVMGSWLMILAYALQIFFDFAGYSHMAIGLGNMFGFKLNENFNYPYIATSISDFWRRWHMTLGAWFKEYIYIPLGGNRVSTIRNIVNLLIVWCLTGIWHGANFTFMAWGLYYGILLVLEKFVFHKILAKLPNVIKRIITFILVLIGWTFFSSSSISEAFILIGSMFGIGASFLSSTVLFYGETYLLYLIFGVIAATPLLRYCGILASYYFPKYSYVVTECLIFLLLILSISFMISDTYQAFLYFSF